MKLYIGVTDKNWFEFLSKQPGLDEVNFWQPGGSQRFKALQPGELFLFKLHSPLNYIAGGGFFAHSTLLPVSLAWESYGISNGASSFFEMRRKIEAYRDQARSPREDFQIGCILLEQPFFWPREQWIPVPPGWGPNIVQGKGYELDTLEGRRLWDQVQTRLQARIDVDQQVPVTTETLTCYGEPTIVLPRLGQGSFRVIVTDAYQRRCAVTHERTLPALEAAHIKSYSDSGPHRVDNGILLRFDLHRLFDTGSVTITPDYYFEI